MDRHDEERSGRISVTFDVDRPPEEAFALVADRLSDGLRRLGVEMEGRPDGAVRDYKTAYGRVAVWNPPSEAAFELRPVTWTTSPTLSVRLTLVPTKSGARVGVDIEGGSEVLEAAGDRGSDWYAGALLPRILGLLGPTALGDWITDRKARRPSGDAAVATYRDPTYHWPNFLHILDELRLTPSDRLLEVACGGGAFLRKALEAGGTAVAVDHSPDLLRVAREANAAAIRDGRLRILEAEADRLPVPDGAFTCCVCTGAFGFFPDPKGSLAEMYRALEPGGRLALYSSSVALRGTPAAPEPIASRVAYYTPEELLALAHGAGFVDARVDQGDDAEYARRAGLPEGVVGFFRGGKGNQLLLARKPAPP